jgi:GNAT superfamily N-acetyltransferase
LSGLRAVTAIAIEKAKPADIDQLVPLFEAYRAFYRRAPAPDAARGFLTERLARDDSAIFLARDGAGAAVGFMQLYPLFGSLEMRPIWLLNDLYVALSARRAGVAHALLQRAEAFARETGAARLMLDTQISNRTAQRVYETAGWARDTEFYVYNRTIRPDPS